MKKKILFIILLLSNFTLAVSSDSDFNTFYDPRPKYGQLFKITEKGNEVKKVSSITNSLLIICWGSDPSKVKYQISGVNGMHDLSRTISFIKHFYQNIEPTTVPNIIVAFNQWGISSKINNLLKPISKSHNFDIYSAGGYAFTKAKLRKEPDSRIKLFLKSWESTEKE